MWNRAWKLWAYYELGWGGFWFWDPVENAFTSLVNILGFTSYHNHFNKKEIFTKLDAFLSIITFFESIRNFFSKIEF